jgi:hypothetical protein
MLQKTVIRRVRDPVKTDTRAHFSYFSGQGYRQENGRPVGGYPAVRIFPNYGKRWFTGRTTMAIFASVTLYGAFLMPEWNRYEREVVFENNERLMTQLAYQQAEVNLRYFVSAYKRHRYEEECIFPKGYPGLSREFRKFFYHDDVWRPEFFDALVHHNNRMGGMVTSYNWTAVYW